MPSASPTRRILINVFLSFHLIAIFVWVLPVDSRSFVDVRSKLAPYMQWSGLIQGWDLFAPEPQSVNSYLVAQITYRDGQKKVWKFPAPQDFGYFRRYYMSRQLKWSSDNLRLDANATLWPDAARYIARLNNDPNNSPVTVTLVRYWSSVVPPESGRAENWNWYAFFTYSVIPRDLL